LDDKRSKQISEVNRSASYMPMRVLFIRMLYKEEQSLVLGRSPYQWQHEPVLYGWKKNGKHQWYTGRKETPSGNLTSPRRTVIIRL
jgi:hypothetical protein